MEPLNSTETDQPDESLTSENLIEEGSLTSESLIEEVSIDGMCGVY